MYEILHFFSNLLNADGFPPRWGCGLWTHFHGWLYVISDLLIWSAYMSIPLILVLFIRQRRDMPFPRIFWLFATFIFACGTTHLFDALMFWWPAYRLSALVYLWTGVVSWVTVFALIPIIPQALTLKSPAELEKIVSERTAELADKTRELEEANRRIGETNRTLQMYAQRLQESNKELEEFATIASHDLQAPLRKIMMFSDAIEQTTQDGSEVETQEYIRRMQKATRKMQNLVTDLLDLSRVNRKGRPFKPTDLNAVAKEVLSELQPAIDETGASVEVENLDTIDADMIQITQVMQNLLDNALKFHRDGVAPEVRVSSKLTAEGNCELRVEDNGIGFDESYADRIFQTFERLHGEKYAGTGIGLALCKKIAERHGGTLTVKSTPGEGSVFTLTLPAVHESSGGFNTTEE